MEKKARLRICKVIKKAPNLLILDEPTNHMDIIGKESLENVLSKYKGTMLFVSHDRYFVNKIADSLLIFEPNKVTYFNGTYEEYSKRKQEEKQSETRTIYSVEDNNKKEKNNNQYYINKEKNKISNKIRNKITKLGDCKSR